MKQKKISKRDHWLDYADEKYSKKMISGKTILIFQNPLNDF